MAQLVENPLAMWETWVHSLGWEDPLEEERLPLQYSGLENSMDCIVQNSPVQNTGVGSLSLLQGIFPTQGMNPGLSHCGWILY